MHQKNHFGILAPKSIFKTYCSVSRVYGRTEFYLVASGKLKKNPVSCRQGELLKYGVPELQDTMSKYLRSVEPFLTQEEMAETKKSVEEFLQPGGEGEKLQEILKLRTAEKDNWVRFSDLKCTALYINKDECL